MADTPQSSDAPADAASLQSRLDQNFMDGTLAKAVEALAESATDIVVQSCLYEAANRLGQAVADSFDAAMNEAAIVTLRTVANDALGGNCAFADDDAKLLAGLARLAISAGLTDSLQGTVLDSLNRKHKRGKYAVAANHEATQENPGASE